MPHVLVLAGDGDQRTSTRMGTGVPLQYCQASSSSALQKSTGRDYTHVA